MDDLKICPSTGSGARFENGELMIDDLNMEIEIITIKPLAHFLTSTLAN
jgi:hypothetical protein